MRPNLTLILQACFTKYLERLLNERLFKFYKEPKNGYVESNPVTRSLCLFMESDGLGLWGNKSDIEYKIVHVDGQKYLIATYIQYIKCALYNPQILHVPLWINAV